MFSVGQHICEVASLIRHRHAMSFNTYLRGYGSHSSNSSSLFVSNHVFSISLCSAASGLVLVFPQLCHTQITFKLITSKPPSHFLFVCFFKGQEGDMSGAFTPACDFCEYHCHVVLSKLVSVRAAQNSKPQTQKETKLRMSSQCQ